MTVEVAVGMVLGAAQTLFAALQCKELKEFYSKFKYDSQLEALRGTVETIQKVLLDADSRHLELNNQGLEWVNKLKDAVYEADDLFDKFATVAQQHKRMPGSKIPKKVHAFFSSENQLLFRFRTCNEIKEIRKKLDGVAKDHTQFGFSDVYRPVKRKEETWSYVHQDSIIGRDTDKEEIMGMLLRESDSSVDSVSFVSIVGMAGLGKTALAQLVYNDVRINDEFDLKLWVCVSDDFIMQEILCKMLKSATEQDHGDIGAEGVQNKVRHCIEGKKYFLIPDDLWNESRDEWLKLRDFLQVGARGSRVVVTTRSERVAGAIGDYPMFRLRGLSDDYSWRLFKRVAFNLGSREIDDDLVDLGKNIVKKCANDYGIQKELLIRLWSAQGYLEPINDMQNTEDVGEEYFSILLQRCFFQDVEYYHGEIGSCKMHDLIHDLAQEIAGKESYLMEDTSKSPFDRKSRHLAILVRRSLVLSPSDTFSKLSGLRTLLRHHWLECESHVSTILANCRRLRVLDLHKLKIKALTSTIKNLLHLRLEELPKDLRELVNLKHLEMTYCLSLTHMPLEWIV
ncbi:putative disease resistance protein RGA1 [Chenopodium quinoa]|uniref:putative disease resistance protein RGA1 n=1 Tax=Chenopodium quinoa TaxID=63459 RepID=UPI000B79544C|nr:putative disease resistance protein RGA1 [Chenopodium quinoa]